MSEKSVIVNITGVLVIVVKPLVQTFPTVYGTKVTTACFYLWCNA